MYVEYVKYAIICIICWICKICWFYIFNIFCIFTEWLDNNGSKLVTLVYEQKETQQVLYVVQHTSAHYLNSDKACTGSSWGYWHNPLS